jgi:hypothetical protein
MAESIVAKRLIRNLRYKLTYVKIFETYLEAETGRHGSGVEVATLFESLIDAQQAAIALLSSYLRSQDISIQDLELNEKLLGQAFERADTKSRLRFVQDGLNRAVSWYKTQLMDKQMTADRALEQLLLELGEIDAAKLWRTEAVMGMLRVSIQVEDKDWEGLAEDASQPELGPEEEWRPRLVEDLSRPDWAPDWRGSRYSRWQRPSKPRRKD